MDSASLVIRDDARGDGCTPEPDRGLGYRCYPVSMSAWRPLLFDGDAERARAACLAIGDALLAWAPRVTTPDLATGPRGA